MRNAKRLLKTASIVAVAILVAFAIQSCEPEEVYNEVTASFSSTADGNTVTFINASVNAETYSWDFGDGGTSTEEAPTHTYSEKGAYMVTLTASNPEYSDEDTKEVFTEHGGPIASVVVGQTWIPIREENMALSIGPIDDTWTYDEHVWFTWGDKEGAATQLAQRISLANDEYTFNGDGTYDVEFNGDFWGEFGVWSGVEGADEVDIDITGGSLPLNTDGVNVDDFITGTWEWVIDEVAMTLEVKGSGAHIMNPRVKNGELTFVPGTGIKYDVIKAVKGETADTLVLRVDTDGFREYHILAAYHGTVPDMKEIVVVDPQYPNSVDATLFTHTFTSETGKGASLDRVETSYVVTYGESMGGETCTKMNRDGSDQYADFKFRTADAELDFTNGTTVKLDVYFPSANTYGDLTKKVTVNFFDNSRLSEFWNEYIGMTSDEIALDTWTTVTFDFAAAIAAGAAAGNSPDALLIQFGGQGHSATGDFYIKNFIIE